MHVKIVALLIKLIDWQYYAFQNTVDSRYCEHFRGVGADLGSVIAGYERKKLFGRFF